jgi:endogenous inhibitor of DNA gyrase (YacG/DUF329 family)
VADPKTGENRSIPCAICRRPTIAKFHPFCSQRCADVDLGRWFAESYRIPASAPDPSNTDDDNSVG